MRPILFVLGFAIGFLAYAQTDHVDQVSAQLWKIQIARYYCHTEPEAIEKEIFAASPQRATELFLLKINLRYDSGEVYATTSDGKKVAVTGISCQ